MNFQDKLKQDIDAQKKQRIIPPTLIYIIIHSYIVLWTYSQLRFPLSLSTKLGGVSFAYLKTPVFLLQTNFMVFGLQRSVKESRLRTSIPWFKSQVYYLLQCDAERFTRTTLCFGF